MSIQRAACCHSPHLLAITFAIVLSVEMPLGAQDKNPGKQLDLSKIATAPVWFIGRVVTLDRLAKHRLRKISGLDKIEAATDEYSAVKWLLNVVADADYDDIRCIPIRHPRLVKLLKLDMLPRYAAFERLWRSRQKDARLPAFRISINELRTEFRCNSNGDTTCARG